MKFHCEGIGVEIRAEGDEARAALALLDEDFSAFPRRGGETELLRFFLSSPGKASGRLGFPILRAGSCRAYGWGSRRSCTYSDGTWLRSWRKVSREVFEISGDHAAGIRETAWEAILSSLGEALDRKGFHRVHALGLEADGRAGLLLLPSGGGKSTLGALIALNAESGIRILSEETPLVRRGFLYPFPLRIGLTLSTATRYLEEPGTPFPRRRFATKLTYPIQDSRVAPPARASFVLVGASGRFPRARLQPAGRLVAFLELFRSLAVGIGVAQMREHVLRVNNPWALLTTFLSRLNQVLRLSSGCQVYRLELSENAHETLGVLREFLTQKGLEEALEPVTMGFDNELHRHPSSDSGLPAPVASAGQREPESAVPEDGGGLPLGGFEPDHHVRGSESGLPTHS